MTFTIRPATDADADALAEVAAVTFPLACPPHTTEEAKASFIAAVLSAERFAEYAADLQRRLFVAEDDAGEIIGYTLVNLGEPGDDDVRAAVTVRPTAELSKCYVMPGHHGEGVAGRLMETSLAAAADAGATGVWLGVNEENARAQRFYGKLLCLRTSVTNLPQDIGDTWALFGGDSSPRSLRNEPCRTR